MAQTKRRSGLMAILPAVTLFLASAIPALADISLTGSLLSGDPNDVLLISFSVASPQTVTMQSFGFGGGTNALGTVIPAGGFDTYFSLFQGTGSGATFLVSNDDGPTLGDSLLTESLAAGSYTLAVSYFLNMSFAENSPPPDSLSAGFIDLGIDTGSTPDYAVDITARDPGAVTLIGTETTAVPEPGSTALLATVILALGGINTIRRRAAVARKELR